LRGRAGWGRYGDFDGLTVGVGVGRIVGIGVGVGGIVGIGVGSGLSVGTIDGRMPVGVTVG
jgi:hypothetical protein